MLYRSMLALTVMLAAAPALAQEYGPLTQDRSTVVNDYCIPAPYVSKKELSDGWTTYRIEFINNCNINYWISAELVPAVPSDPPSPQGTALPAFGNASLTCYFNPSHPGKTCKGFGELGVKRQ